MLLPRLKRRRIPSGRSDRGVEDTWVLQWPLPLVRGGGLRCLPALLTGAARVVTGAEGAEVLEPVVVAVADLVAVGGVQAACLTGVGALVLALVLVALEDGEALAFPVGGERDAAGASAPAGHDDRPP